MFHVHQLHPKSCNICKSMANMRVWHNWPRILSLSFHFIFFFSIQLAYSFFTICLHQLAVFVFVILRLHGVEPRRRRQRYIVRKRQDDHQCVRVCMSYISSWVDRPNSQSNRIVHHFLPIHIYCDWIKLTRARLWCFVFSINKWNKCHWYINPFVWINSCMNECRFHLFVCTECGQHCVTSLQPHDQK